MKKIYIAFLFIIITFLACQTTSNTVPGDQPPVKEPDNTEITAPGTVPPKAEPENFDPTTITKEEFDTTKTDVQQLIQNLNTIIREKDYQTWVTYLSKDYFDSISDPEYLSNLSESTRLKNQKTVLRTPEDYFQYVVVPSRANDRVDDIEFIGKNQVKAFTVTPNGQRLRLYNLEKQGENWKITL